MNFKKTALISAAAILALSAAACGKVEKDSSDIALDIHTATNNVESTTTSDDESTTTTAAVTTSAVSTKPGVTTTKKGYSANTNGSAPTVTTPADKKPAQDNPTPPPDEPDTQAPPEPTSPPTEPPTEPPVEEVKFDFGSLQADAAPFIADIPVQFTRGGGDGCVTGNYDVISYKSSDIVIDCYVDGGVEYIFSVMINSDICSTSQGIKVGSSRAEVEAAYGIGDGGSNSVCYTEGSKEMWIDYSGDTVSGIQFYIAV